jgi:hypothetical protein
MGKHLKQHDMFANSAEDTPLFSGVAPRQKESVFNVTAKPVQQGLFSGTCPICLGTGYVVTKHGKKPVRCICQQ